MGFAIKENYGEFKFYANFNDSLGEGKDDIKNTNGCFFLLDCCFCKFVFIYILCVILHAETMQNLVKDNKIKISKTTKIKYFLF